MNELQESISKCTVEGNVLTLPKEMLSNYAQVKAALQKAGGVYKKNTFVFKSEAQPIIDRLLGGEKVNIKKETQFFATPSQLADDLVFEAQVEPYDEILEPSAGEGAIVDALLRLEFDLTITLVEKNVDNKIFLRKKYSNNEGISFANPPNNDFLEYNGSGYDRIIANPPFSKNQDIDHIMKMYECLNSGGRLVSIASTHWQDSKNKKETEFRAWLKELKADVREIEAGAFKESGTNVKTVMIIINKP